MKKLNLFNYLLFFFVLIVISGCDKTRANYAISISENYEQFLKNRPTNFKMPIPNPDFAITVSPTLDPLKIKNKIGTYFWYNETYDFVSKKKEISLEVDQIISNFLMKKGYWKEKGKWKTNKDSLKNLRTPYALAITIKKLNFHGEEDIPYDIINGTVYLELSLGIKKKKRIQKVNIESKLQIQGDHPVPHIADRIKTVIRQSVLEGLEKLFSKI
tara:strand:- start:8676 stop:9320 length:645 start_codon:yes stop_codon:yes gene_type:complete